VTAPHVVRWPIKPLDRELTPEDRLPVLDPPAYRELSSATFRLPAGSPVRKDLISLAVQVGNAATRSGDDELRFATYAPDVELHIVDPRWLASDIEPLHRGIEGFQRMLGRLEEAFGTMRWENHEILDAGGDRFAIRLELVAVGRDSGIETRQQQWHVFELEGGLITRQIAFATEEDAVAALSERLR
jgi:SnoaL-like domain